MMPGITLSWVSTGATLQTGQWALGSDGRQWRLDEDGWRPIS
jgi:hypothetical protein